MSCVVASRRALLCRHISTAISSSNGLFLHRLGCCSSWRWPRGCLHQRSSSTLTTQYFNILQTLRTLSLSSASSLAATTTNERTRGVLPWLFLTDEYSGDRHLYNFAQEKITHKMRLPVPRVIHDIIGSSECFLLTVHSLSQEIHAINPLTGSQLLLPSTASLPNMIGILLSNSLDEITHYVIQHV